MLYIYIYIYIYEIFYHLVDVLADSIREVVMFMLVRGTVGWLREIALWLRGLDASSIFVCTVDKCLARVCMVILKCTIKSYKLLHHVYTFGKGMNPLILLAMGKIVPLQFFEKDGFGIK